MNKIIEGNIVIKDLKGTENSLEIKSGIDSVMLDNPKLITNYRIYGNSIQDGTPTPDTPIEIQSVGDLVTDTSDENYGKYKITVTGKGKNLYSGEREFMYTSIVNSTDQSFYDSFEKGKTYTLFCYIDNTQGTATSGFRMSVGKVTDGVNSWNYLSSNSINAGNEGYSRVIIQIPDNYNGQLNMQYQARGGTTIYRDIMLVEGNYTLSNLPQYESYFNATTNIYLDEPLRKVGDYADYIDFENGKVIRNTMYRSFTGNETISIPSSVIEGHTPFRYLDLSGIARQPFLCNYLTFSGKEYSQSSTECLAKYATGGQMFFIISNDRIPLNDTTAFKKWLKELYLSDNPLKVYYDLATPTEETIDLPTIPINEETNIIEVNTNISPSRIDVEYVK